MCSHRDRLPDTCSDYSDLSADTSEVRTDPLEGSICSRLKKPRYSCVFHPETVSWAKVSAKGPSYAHCTVCNRDVNVAYGGSKDLKRHEQTNIHQNFLKKFEWCKITFLLF